MTGRLFMDGSMMQSTEQLGGLLLSSKSGGVVPLIRETLVLSIPKLQHSMLPLLT